MKKNSAKSKLAVAPANWLTFDLVVELLLLVIIFLAPLIFDRRLGIVFSGTKIAWLRCLVIVVLSVWSLKIIVTKEHRFIRTPLDWPIATFLLTTTVATLTAVHVYTSFAGFYGRFEGLSTWYVYGLLFLITTNYIQTFDQLKRIIATIVPASIIMSVYGMIQRHDLDPYMWGGVPTKERVIGMIGQPNFFAAYILMAFFLILVLYLEEKKSAVNFDWSRQMAPLAGLLISALTFVFMIYTMEAQDVYLWYAGFTLMTGAALFFAYKYTEIHPVLLDLILGITMVLIYISLLYTQSRGGYMGFFCGAALFAIIAGRHNLFRHWKELSLLGLAIVLVSVITMMNPEYSPFERFTAEVSTKEQALELKGAAGSRGETWKSAFKIIADNPVFGIGPENMKMVFPRYETELFRFRETFHVKQDRSHNETFDVPVTKGLISLFLYIWIIFTIFKIGISKARNAGDPQKMMMAGLLAAILAYLIQNQFSFGVVAITSLFWILWALVIVLGKEEPAAAPKTKLTLQDIPWLWAALVVIVCVPLIYVSFLSFRGDVYFKTGKTLLEMRRFPEAVAQLQKSLAVFPFEGITISHVGIAYLNMGDTANAIKYLDYGTKVDPYNADNFYMLSRVYLSLYDRGAKAELTAAMKNIDIALKIDPYYAEAYETRGNICERQGQRPEAVAMYEKAFAVNPNLPGPILKIEQLSPRARQIFAAAARRFPDNIELFKAYERVK